jgi:hypothetical protein
MKRGLWSPFLFMVNIKVILNFMNKFFILLAAFFSSFAFAQEKTIKNNAFGIGEVLNFRLHYGFINAGTATLEVNSAFDSITNRTCFRVTGTAKSLRSFDWIFKVRDTYESIIDARTIVPYVFNRKIEEGHYKKEEHIRFDRQNQIAYNGTDTYRVPENVQDIISFFYYVRTIDFSNAFIGQIFPIMGFLDNKVISLNVKYVGKETVNTDLGKISCMVLEPLLQDSKVMKDRENMKVWLTDDQNKIPVKVQASILVGSLNMDIISVKNISNPILVVSE